MNRLINYKDFAQNINHMQWITRFSIHQLAHITLMYY